MLKSISTSVSLFVSLSLSLCLSFSLCACTYTPNSSFQICFIIGKIKSHVFSLPLCFYVHLRMLHPIHIKISSWYFQCQREFPLVICLKQLIRFYLSYCSRGKRLQYRTELNFSYSTNSWWFTVNVQCERSSGWKNLGRNLIDVKAGRRRNSIRYQEWEFLYKLSSTGQVHGPVKKRAQKTLTKILSIRESLSSVTHHHILGVLHHNLNIRCSLAVRAGKGLKTNSYCTDEKTETYRGWVLCTRSHASRCRELHWRQSPEPKPRKLFCE